jgi:hypothetical protein
MPPPGVERIPQALLDRLVKAAQAPPPVKADRKPISPPSDPRVKPEARLPPIDSVGIARANTLAAVSTGEIGKR